MEPSKSIFDSFLEGGWLVPFIGAAGMMARILSSKDHVTFELLCKRIPAAAISSGIAWYVLEQTDISSLYKAVIYGVIGVISPEVIEGLVSLARRFAKNPEKLIRK